MKTKTLRGDPIRYAGFPINDSDKLKKQTAYQAQQTKIAESQLATYDQTILFTFRFNTGEGSKQVYRAAFDAMVKAGVEIGEDAIVVAKIQHGSQMNAQQAKTENHGLWAGVMQACACNGLWLQWVSRGMVTDEVLVEVSYAEQTGAEDGGGSLL